MPEPGASIRGGSDKGIPVGKIVGNAVVVVASIRPCAIFFGLANSGCTAVLHSTLACSVGDFLNRFFATKASAASRCAACLLAEQAACAHHRKVAARTFTLIRNVPAIVRRAIKDLQSSEGLVRQIGILLPGTFHCLPRCARTRDARACKSR